MQQDFEITDDGTAVRGLTRQGRMACVSIVMAGNRTRFDVSVEPMPGIPDEDEYAVDIEAGRVAAEHGAIIRRLAERFGEDLTSYGNAELLAGSASALGRVEVDAAAVEALLAEAIPSPVRAA